MGAAGGGRGQGGHHTQARRQRLGVHAVRRHGPLGQGRRPYADAAGDGPVLRTRCRIGCARKGLGAAGLPKEIQELVQLDAAKRSDAQEKQLRDYFVGHACSKTRAKFAPLLRQIADVEKEIAELDKQVPSTLVFKERADIKPAYILKRGEYDKKLDKVGRDTPAFLPPLPPDAPKNRLGLAQWLIAPNHPLTARVEVNRLWQQVFGVGLVKTAEDFGTQGEAPSHPELLDWLAVQFREDGWDVKKTMKRLVMSATYRQSSHGTPEQLAKDPATGCCRTGRASASTPRSCATRRWRRAASWWRRSAGRASSRRSRRGCGRPSVTPAATPSISRPTPGTRRSTAAACTPSGSAPPRRRR